MGVLKGNVRMKEHRKARGNEPSRVPILLSGMVYPGLGQACQGRWGPAAAIGGGFGAALVCFVVEASRVLGVYYSLHDRLADAGVIEPPDWRGMMVALGAAVVFYAVGLVDVFLAYNRRRSEASARRHGLLPEEAETRPPPP